MSRSRDRLDRDPHRFVDRRSAGDLRRDEPHRRGDRGGLPAHRRDPGILFADALDDVLPSGGQDLGRSPARRVAADRPAVKMVKSLAGSSTSTSRPAVRSSTFASSSPAPRREPAEHLSQLHAVRRHGRRRPGRADPEQLMADRSAWSRRSGRTRLCSALAERWRSWARCVERFLRPVRPFPGGEDGPESDAAHEGRALSNGLSNGLPGRAPWRTLGRAAARSRTCRTRGHRGDGRHAAIGSFTVRGAADRAVRLPSQTERLAREVGLLEALIELQFAELDVSPRWVPRSRRA